LHDISRLLELLDKKNEKNDSSMDAELIQKISEEPLLFGVSLTSTVFLRNVITAVFQKNMEAALDEIFSLANEEIPDEFAESYLNAAVNICASCEYADGWVMFSKELIRLYANTGRAVEAKALLEGLEELLTNDEELVELRELVNDGLETGSESLVAIREQETVDSGFKALTEKLAQMSEDDIFKLIMEKYEKLSSKDKLNIIVYFKSFPFWGSFDPENKVFDALRERARVLSKHFDDLMWLYDRLADARSKNVLYGIISNWVSFDESTIEKYSNRGDPEYYHTDVFPHKEEDVFVDVGAYTGDSVATYIEIYGLSYKRIYCYEIAPDSFSKLEENLAGVPNTDLRKKAVGAASGTMFVDFGSFKSSERVSDKGETEVEVVRIDDDIPEPVTFIKMDIEGGEKDALRGCERQIRDNHPRLAISTYHGYDDLYAIPRLIDEIVSGYKFYMRTHGGNFIPTEFSLLAVYEDEPSVGGKSLPECNESKRSGGSDTDAGVERVAIVGANMLGIAIASSISSDLNNKKFKLECICNLAGKEAADSIGFVKVVSLNDLADMCQKGKIDKIIVAIASIFNPSPSDTFRMLRDVGITDDLYIVPPWYIDGAYDYVAVSPFESCEEMPLTSVLVKADMNKAVLDFISPHSNLHCNFRCASCCMAAPIAKPGFTTISSFRKDINRLKELYWHINRIRITGGETLLHPEIGEMVKITREAFPAAGLGLQTNGALLLKDDDRLKGLFEIMRENRCGFQISTYDPTVKKKVKLADILRKHGVQWHWGQISGETIKEFECFRTIRPESDMNKQFEDCVQAKYCHSLLDGFVYPCWSAISAKTIEDHFGVEFEGLSEILDKTRVNIHDTALDGWEIVDFFNSPNPMCSYCCYERLRKVKWTQFSPADAKLEDFIIT